MGSTRKLAQDFQGATTSPGKGIRDDRSNTDSIQEYAAWAFFQWDDGSGHHEWTISQPRDQHVDDHNFHTQRDIAKTFPAGRVTTIIRPAMNPAFCTNRPDLLAVGNDCQTGQPITLAGK